MVVVGNGGGGNVSWSSCVPMDQGGGAMIPSRQALHPLWLCGLTELVFSISTQEKHSLALSLGLRTMV